MSSTMEELSKKTSSTFTSSSNWWQHRGSAIYSLLVFTLWTVTSFLCHYCAKLYLSTQEEDAEGPKNDVFGRIFHACVITAVQLTFCFLAVDMGSFANVRTAQITHSLATLATNLSMSLMFASNTFAIKMMEPITSAITQYFMMGTALSPFAIASLPIIVGGAIAFSGNPLSDVKLSYGIVAAIASNVILAIRNVVLKGNQTEESSRMTLRYSLFKVMSVSVVCLSGLYLLKVSGYDYNHLIFSISMCYLSGVFHVSYSYVSTGLVLKQLSVVSHAVANILKRSLVVLLLYMVGKRVATPYNFLGLVVCTLGLLLYTWDKNRGKTDLHPLLKGTLYRKAGIIFLMCMIGSGAFITVSAYLTTTQVRVMKQERDSEAISGFLPNRMDHTFTHLAHTKMKNLEPDLTGYLFNQSTEIQTFLKKRLLHSPAIADELSKKLKTHIEVTKEAQRIHFNMLGDALKKYKYAILLDIASFENKGDPCITIGEIYFLARIQLPILYYCNFHACKDHNLQILQKVVLNYTVDEVVVLVHGGGNIAGYPANDRMRFKFMELFRGYQMFVFPQSIWVWDFDFRTAHFKRCMENYCCNENITLVLRDKQSYGIARRYFNGTSRLLMAPDMAFQIGPMDRFISPVFDVMWIRRGDKERPGYNKTIPDYPAGLRVHISDWWRWPTPRAGSNLEQAFYICTNGFFYLQRGRVIITDRLHGHILATLMNIPHVLIDNNVKKLSAYHGTWTKSLDNTLITDNAEEALKMAIGLLKKYDAILPPRVPFLNVSEHFRPINFRRPEDFI